MSKIEKNEKDSDDFCHRKLILKFKFFKTLFDAFRPILKINYFLWGCLSKIFFNFVPPIWKLDNPYYHNLRIVIERFCTLFKYLTHFHYEVYFLFWVRTCVSRKVFEEKLWFSIKTINNPYFRLFLLVKFLFWTA